jgi:hypothetical protein
MTVYLRDQWGSTLPKGGYEIVGLVGEAYVHHYNSGIQPARTVDEAMARMRGAQQYHAVTQGWGDIGYSWCVDWAGNIYEGRGWFRTGAHTYGYNSKGYGICGLFDSNVLPPSDAMVAGIAECIRMGIDAGALVAGPTVVAHRDRVPDTSCCGDPMYLRLDEIRALVAGGVPGPATDGGTEKEAAEMPLYMMGLRNGDVVAVYDGGFTRQIGFAEYDHLSKAKVLLLPTANEAEDAILRAGL